MIKKLITYAGAMAQPCLIHSPTDLASGNILHNATPEEEPNQIIDPPKPTV